MLLQRFMSIGRQEPVKTKRRNGEKSGLSIKVAKEKPYFGKTSPYRQKQDWGRAVIHPKPLVTTKCFSHFWGWIGNPMHWALEPALSGSACPKQAGKRSKLLYI